MSKCGVDQKDPAFETRMIQFFKMSNELEKFAFHKGDNSDDVGLEEINIDSNQPQANVPYSLSGFKQSNLKEIGNFIH